MPRFIISLSIPNVGEETAILLSNEFESIERLKEAKIERLEKIEGIGPIVAESIVEWFEDKENQKLLSKLLKHVTIEQSESSSQDLGKKLEGKTFVLTGTLETMSREEAKQKIRDLGGNISSSVSKETDFIVAGENPGTKYEKALELGVQVLNERELEKIIRM